MSVANHLKKNSSNFLNLFKNREELIFESISLIDVHASTIVTQCLSIYERKFSWMRLLVRSLLAIKYLSFYIIKKLFSIKFKRIKNNPNNKQKINDSTFLIINTNLAKRELYDPLMGGAANSNAKITSFCIRSAKENGSEIEIDKSFAFTCYHTYKIFKLVFTHLLYSLRVRPKKSFLVNYSFMANLPAIVDAMEMINHCVIHGVSPNNIVYDDINDPATRIIALYFKKFGIHINVLQFGHYEKESVEWSYVIADTLFLWGEHYLKLLVDEHNLSKNICVKKIGSPRFDYLFENRKDSPHHHQICDKNKYGLLFSTYSIKNYDGWVENNIINKLKHDVIEEFNKIQASNINLLIKPHPYESSLDISEWNKLSNEFVKILDQKIDVRSLIANASFIITFGSGLTLDALVANKNVLIPNWYNSFPWELELLEAAGANLLKSKLELNSEILRSVSKEVMNHEKKILNFVSNNKAISDEMLKDFFIDTHKQYFIDENSY